MRTLAVLWTSVLSTSLLAGALLADTPRRPADVFFDGLAALCGQTFAGRIVANEPPNPSDPFAGQKLVMHVRECGAEEIRVPFHVGENRSRTWVITRTAAGLRLKHDHRHEDGSEDVVTQYGGDTVTSGSANRQEFPADAASRELFTRQNMPASLPNIWALELEPGQRFVYELARPGRLFRVEFDLSQPIALASENPPPSGDASLSALADLMTGVFSSAEQAAADAEFRHVRLVMVPIWTQREDGPWLYVEQAMAEALDRPYRQRVYRLRETGGGGVESVVYTLPGDPLRLAASWKNPSAWEQLSPADLSERAGCAIRLAQREDGTWNGATAAKSCPSDLRGATYATSEVEISKSLLISWDRGFNAEGRQVWGAEKGGYRFLKLAASH